MSLLLTTIHELALPSWWNEPFFAMECHLHRGQLLQVALHASESVSLRIRFVGEENSQVMGHIVEWVSLYLRGEDPPVAFLPLEWNCFPRFTKSVLQFLPTIPCGQTLSYQEVSEALDKPHAARAVGNACGKNPFLFFIPCHRVIASDGSLGGFSAGLAFKEKLLCFEQELIQRYIPK